MDNSSLSDDSESTCGNERPEFYHDISLIINDEVELTHSNKTVDFVSGFFLACRIFLSDKDFYVWADGIKLSDLENFHEFGRGYISYENKTTKQALKCHDSKEVPCEFRELRPDDGTEAVWVFDHDEKDGPRWNLIMTDNLKDFMYGFYSIFKFFDDVDMWDYILGEPLGSEGSIGDWVYLKTEIFMEKINMENFYQQFHKFKQRK